MRSYIVKEIILKNVVKLKLLASIRIHPVVNFSRIIRYRKLVKGQRVEELKLVKVNRVKE